MGMRVADLPSSIRHEVVAGNTKRAKKVLQVIKETIGLPGDTAVEAVRSVLKAEFPDLDLNALGSARRGTGKLANIARAPITDPDPEPIPAERNGKHSPPPRVAPRKEKLSEMERLADRAIQSLLENDRLPLAKLEEACDRIASATYQREPRMRWAPAKSIGFLVEMGYVDGDPNELEKNEIHYADGRLVREARERRGFSQDEVVKRSNELMGGDFREKTQLSRQESGEKALFGSQLTATALVLGIPEQWLWNGAEALPDDLPPIPDEEFQRILEARTKLPLASQEQTTEPAVAPVEAPGETAERQDGTPPERALPHRVSIARKALGMGQMDLAVAVGKPFIAGDISHIENGKRVISGENLLRFASALRRTPEWLAGEGTVTDPMLDPEPALPSPEPEGTAAVAMHSDLLDTQENPTDLSSALHGIMLQMGGFSKRARLLEKELARGPQVEALQARVSELEERLGTEIRKRIEAEDRAKETARLDQLVSRQKAVIESQRATISHLEETLLGDAEAPTT